MNLTQIKAIFDSFNISSRASRHGHAMAFKEDQFTIEPSDFDDWFMEHPRSWEISALNGVVEIITAVVSDEFELQDWLINECPPN